MRWNPCEVRLNIEMNIPARGSMGQMGALGYGDQSERVGRNARV